MGNFKEEFYYQRNGPRNEDEQERAWSKEGLDSYEHTFRGVLPQTSILEIYEDKYESDPNMKVLDFMGYGDVLRNLSTDIPGRGQPNHIALALSDRRTDDERMFDQAHSIDFLQGNVLSGRTWAKLRSWLQNHGEHNRGFSLIMARPMGAILKIPEPFRYPLLQKLWKLTDVQSGILLAQLTYSSQTAEQFVKSILEFEKLVSQQGISMTWNQEQVVEHNNNTIVMKLVKTPNAPQQLPRFSFYRHFEY